MKSKKYCNKNLRHYLIDFQYVIHRIHVSLKISQNQVKNGAHLYNPVFSSYKNH